MGRLAIACSVGYTGAPILGSVLYSEGGFNLPFYTFGAIFFIMTLFSFTLLDDTIDGKVNKKENSPPR